MNKTIKIFRYVVTIVFVTILISCSNLFETIQEKTVPEKSYIKLNLGDSARTVLPEIQNPVFTDFELKGGKTGEIQVTLGSWATETEMQNAEIPVYTGNWSFTLSAKKDDSTFQGTMEKAIVAGQNTLSFTLFLSDSGTETGSFIITLSFANAQNTDTISYATGTLENMDRTAVNGVNSQNLTPSNNTVIFSGSEIAAGTYRAKIKFYTEVNSIPYEIASYSELVQISSGFCSSANRTIESFEELYTVTYFLNGGSFASGTTIPETFSRKTTLTLPQNISKTGYTFTGWYTDENCTEGNKITNTANRTRNINVYAKYTPVYTITYNLGYSSITDSYTVEDNVTLLEIDEAEDITIESYWYEDENCEGSVITGWTAGEKHSDITLYAKYSVNATANANSIADKIRGMQRSGTVKGTGVFSTQVIREINQALKDLIETLPLVKVTLDLSETTGLTSLEDAYYQNQLHNNYSFYGCANLKEITLPSCLTSIGSGAFGYCTALTSITIPDSVTSIGNSAFTDCSSLASIIIPNSVSSMGESVFFNCSSLKNITLPDNLTSIGMDFFGYCSSLTSIIIPDSVTAIATLAFEYCSSLKNITLPDNLTSIGSGAFTGCSSLTSIIIPNSVTYLGGFSNCTSLTHISIPDSVTAIENYSFVGCTSLKSLTIPDSVTSIGDGAFNGCSSLTSITIPDSVTSIGLWQFLSCDSLEHVVFQDTTSRWKVTPEPRYNNGSGVSVKINPMSATNTANNALLLKETYKYYRWEKITQ
ncbi:MAG: leucine-rich repeat protein [Spirochaetaceae bacterium]|nr:leucine-rich repeat protein [Spirochaetaceae bacterium]